MIKPYIWQENLVGTIFHIPSQVGQLEELVME